MAYDVNKLIKLQALKDLAERVAQDFATKEELGVLNTRVDELVTAGGEPNKIDVIKVNGVDQEITEKAVDITVPTKVSDLENDSKFQTDTEVTASIQSAIAATGHAHFEKADAVPTADTAEENVLYLVMNSKTSHYDIYALVDEEVILIDDTTVDLTAYSTTEEMNGAIEEAIEALKTGDLAAAINRIAALEEIAPTKVEASETNGNIKIDGVETVVYTEPDDVIHGAIAESTEVAEMLDEVFGTAVTE